MAGTCGINVDKVRITNFFTKALLFYLGWSAWEPTGGKGQKVKKSLLSTNFLSDCSCVPLDPTLRKGLARFVGFADDGRVLIWFEKKELITWSFFFSFFLHEQP